MPLRPLIALSALLRRLDTWLERRRQRSLLARLSDRELRDIGVSRYDALSEWRKPFWRA